MSTDEEGENYELSPLGLQYRAELPHILKTSDSDLDAALAALDRYLDQSPPPAFQKALLAWKGRFYLEHHKHDDAVRMLREADALQGQSDMQSVCIRCDLAKALERMGNPQEAYAALAAALEETDALDLLLGPLRAVAGVASRSGLPVPPRAEAALKRVKELHEVEDAPSANAAAEMVRVADVLEDAWVRFSMLRDALEEAETRAEKIGLVEEYLEDAIVPCYRGLAEDLRRRVQQDADQDADTASQEQEETPRR